MRPETRYAKSGETNIAYQVLGNGPLDLVFVPGFVSSLDVLWYSELATKFFERLASFCRVILFDKRGTGASDRDVGPATAMDVRVDDVRAVMEAAGSERAVLFGLSEGGPMAMFYAATYPQRVDALILYGTAARFRPDADYPLGISDDLLAWFETVAGERWGTGEFLLLAMPSQAGTHGISEVAGLIERTVASPRAALAHGRWCTQIDVRAICPSIGVPTLVAHRTRDRFVPLECGRWLADTIPGARFYEHPGEDHIPWTEDGDLLLDEIQEFLTGTRDVREPERELSTVLFTDIVDSTDRASELGDRRWRELLEQHDALVRREIERSRGRVVKKLGDGVLATFDAPARSIRAACAIRRSLLDIGIQIRAGIHTGEIERLGEDVGGIGVHIASRVESRARPGEVLVSSTVKDLVVGSGIDFEDCGSHSLKGIPGEWRLFTVAGEP